MKAHAMLSQDRDIGEDPVAANERQPPRYLQRAFAQIDPFELRLVHRFARYRSRPSALRLAMFMNILGDGWIYPIVAIAILAGLGWDSVRALLTAILAVGFAHAVYPFIKRYMARPRPFEKDPTLIVAVAPIDKYSCPSGHAMTATAAFLPLALAYPPLGVALLAIWCLLAWARLILGHHYASDLIVGAGLGAASTAVSGLLLIPGLASLLPMLFQRT